MYVRKPSQHRVCPSAHLPDIYRYLCLLDRIIPYPTTNNVTPHVAMSTEPATLACGSNPATALRLLGHDVLRSLRATPSTNQSTSHVRMSTLGLIWTAGPTLVSISHQPRQRNLVKSNLSSWSHRKGSALLTPSRTSPQ